MDSNRDQQTATDTSGHCQVLFDESDSVCWCLLVSVGICWRLVLSGDVWGVPLGVSEGIWVVFRQIWGAWMCLGVIWVSSPFWTEQIALFWHSHEVQELFTWLYWDIKISKCPDISFPKITGLCHLFDLLGPSEANYKTQSLGSPCIFNNMYIVYAVQFSSHK